MKEHAETPSRDFRSPAREGEGNPGDLAFAAITRLEGRNTMKKDQSRRTTNSPGGSILRRARTAGQRADDKVGKTKGVYIARNALGPGCDHRQPQKEHDPHRPPAPCARKSGQGMPRDTRNAELRTCEHRPMKTTCTHHEHLKQRSNYPQTEAWTPRPLLEEPQTPLLLPQPRPTPLSVTAVLGFDAAEVVRWSAPPVLLWSLTVKP